MGFTGSNSVEQGYMLVPRRRLCTFRIGPIINQNVLVVHRSERYWIDISIRFKGTSPGWIGVGVGYT
jgi:hypothetical protein